jgi:hypothetical protein
MPILGVIASSKLTAVPSNYESIATVTLGSNQTTVNFNSIPQTYKHLQITASFLETGDGDVQMTYNGDTTMTNYSVHSLGGVGSGTPAGGSNLTTNEIMYLYPANSDSVPVAAVIDFIDYTNTSKFKTQQIWCGCVDTSGNGKISWESQNWRNTAAITSIQLFSHPASTAKTFFTGSKFALYGIKE